MNALWSKKEISATLETYYWMLKQQLAGHEFVKAQVIRELRAGPLASRTKGSVERRFQNYSWLFQQRGFPWVAGYVPLPHVGTRVAAIVDSFLTSAQIPNQASSAL
jgi:5-methylcytosine-specific restriction protein A